jgi:molecular chaperone GrpE
MQNFSKSLLDVADNLARASSAVKESFSKLDTSEDSSGVVSLLKTLLEGVDMTDKQLGEVLCLSSTYYQLKFDFDLVYFLYI